jgi:outer membrane protein, heavy metal efflux system
VKTRSLILQAGWLVALVAAAAGAQSPLSAEDAVRLALARPEVAARLDADLAAAEAELTAARTWPNPAVSLQREAGDRAGGEADETSLLLTQSFELGGRRALQRRAALLGIDAARAEGSTARARLRAEVLRRYHAALIAEQRHRALDARIDRLDRIQAAADSRHAEGDLSGFERMRIAQQRERALLLRESAAADADAARSELAEVLGIRSAELRLPEEIDLPQPAGMPAVDAMAAGAELAALAAQRAHAAAELAAAQRRRLPASIGIGQKRWSGIGARDDALLIELAIPLPLFDRDQAARQRADARLQRADADYRMAQQALLQRRQTASLQAHRLADNARRMHEDLLPRAGELARIAEASFAEGEIDLVGVLAALDEELDTIEHMLDLSSRAQQALIELELLFPATHPGVPR